MSPPDIVRRVVQAWREKVVGMIFCRLATRALQNGPTAGA
jgi:hypothetical protein